MSRCWVPTALISIGRWLPLRCAGLCPVPVYQDSVAEEMAYVLDHCGARFVVAEDQEQVDKVIEVQDRVPTLEQMIYLDPRGMRKYDHSQAAFVRRCAGQWPRGVPMQRWAEMDHPAGQARRRRQHLCDALHLRHDGQVPKGVVLSNDNIAMIEKSQKILGEFDHLRAAEGRYPGLSAHGLGRRFYLFSRAGLLDRFLRELP